MQKLPLETQTLYAELIEQLTALEAYRSIGRVSGCFTTKTVKSEVYHYFQYSEPGGVTRQIYLGKKTPALERVIERFQRERDAVAPDVRQIQRLCAQLRAGGALVTDTPSARVLKALAESGVFHLNGVLVGTHAFTVIGNLLGVQWRYSAARTQDIDIAGEPVLSIGIPNIRADVPKALEQLEMGFLPVPALDRKHPSTSFKVRGKALRVDLLTPATTTGEQSPVFISRFNAAAQPVPFLDYLLEKPEQGAVIDGGGVLVKVPSPGRFAFHKLILSTERPVIMHDKMEKDMIQAAQVFALLADERPGDLILAWEEIKNRGKEWTTRISAGLSHMKRLYPGEYDEISKIIGDLVV